MGTVFSTTYISLGADEPRVRRLNIRGVRRREREGGGVRVRGRGEGSWPAFTLIPFNRCPISSRRFSREQRTPPPLRPRSAYSLRTYRSIDRENERNDNVKK